MYKKLITVLIISICLSAKAQTNKWTYDFGESESIFNPNPGASSKKFGPKPAVNPDKSKQTVRVRNASDGSGELNITKKGPSFFKGAGLEMLAGTTTSKFAIYDIAGTSVLKNSFNIKFDNSTNGQWYYANGNSVDDEDVFRGNSNIKEGSDEIFAGFRWQMAEGDEIAFAYRNGTKWSTLKGTSFAKNTEYMLDIYANNSKEDKTYTKEGNNQTIKAGTSQVWVNGTKVSMDFPNPGLEAGKAINAFIIFGYKPKDSDAKPYAWIDNVEYADNL
ncbi:hypothetical protein I5M32_05250 [Pedobacter sp. SD-b]|uniref:Uncharacterized protein n=1 Tax=Pedobacter segetis TaxID=2793069 RepID=A0ABS1BHS2_9SPHI|nr:hypothetical protein [Pedobacter segetis]MBK0382362.1 hypothetical protein [Pedobacter segetis]